MINDHDKKELSEETLIAWRDNATSSAGWQAWKDVLASRLVEVIDALRTLRQELAEKDQIINKMREGLTYDGKHIAKLEQQLASSKAMMQDYETVWP